MKNTLIAVAALLLLAPGAQAQSAAQTAKAVLTAYQQKDLEGVKKYSSPMIALTMDKKFFDDKDVKAEVKSLQSWNGKVKEVRYYKTKIGVMASAYYDDADKDTYRVLDMINAGYGWKQMAGVDTVSKKKFLSYDKTEPKVEPAPVAASAKKADVVKKAATSAPYSVEMADGTTKKGLSAEELKKMLSSLDDDNFFLTLTAPDGAFLQGGYSEAGLDMEYSDASGHFSSEAAVAPETAEGIFVSYLNGDKGWKGECKWKPFE